jgi:hypothetical protein
MAVTTEGTHLGIRRPREGWPNTSDPEVKPGRKIRKSRERLKARQADFDATMAKSKYAAAYKRPGSLKCR